MSLKDFTAATEAMNAVLEGEEGEPTSTETTVDLEIKVAEEVSAPQEELDDSIEETEVVEETAEEMLAQYAKLEHYHAVVAEFGYSKALAMCIDPDGELQAFAPSLPALENLDVTGSPSSNETIIALEGLKSAMSTFWEWIKKTAIKIKEAVKSLVMKIVNFFSAYDKQAKRIIDALKKAEISDKKMKEHKASIISRGDWETVAKGFVTNASSTMTQLTKMIASPTPEKFAAEFGDANLGQIGLKKSSGGGFVEADGFAKKLEGKEQSVLASGWKKETVVGGLTEVLAIAAMGRAELPKVVKFIEDRTKSLESEASRWIGIAGKKEDSSKDMAKAKAAASASLKTMNAASRVTSQIGKTGNRICKAWIKAAYAVYACRGADDKE